MIQDKKEVDPNEDTSRVQTAPDQPPEPALEEETPAFFKDLEKDHRLSSKQTSDERNSPQKEAPNPVPFNIDELLEQGDDFLDFDTNPFMNNSKLMLKMIDNMIVSIDERIEHVQAGIVTA